MDKKLTLSLDERVIERAYKVYAQDHKISQYYTALENEAEVIITRNLKGFKAAKLPVMTAG